MEELIPVVFVTKEQLQALDSKSWTGKANVLMDCFYSKKEQLNMTLNDTDGKKKKDTIFKCNYWHDMTFVCKM